MHSFEEYLSECLDVEVVGEPGALELHDPEHRDALNFALLDITDASHDTRLVYIEIASTLSGAGYQIPSVSEFPELLESDGEIIIGLIGPDGDPDPCALYFAFSDQEIFAEIVTDEELDDIVSDTDVHDLPNKE
jgi:hypothetical protein